MIALLQVFYLEKVCYFSCVLSQKQMLGEEDNKVLMFEFPVPVEQFGLTRN